MKDVYKRQPLGCPLTVTVENGEVKSVTGNTCKRGELYAVSSHQRTAI